MKRKSEFMVGLDGSGVMGGEGGGYLQTANVDVNWE